MDIGFNGFHIQAESMWTLTWEVPTDDRDATLPRNFLSIEHGLLVFQDLMSEVIACLVSVNMSREDMETYYSTPTHHVNSRC